MFTISMFRQISMYVKRDYTLRQYGDLTNHATQHAQDPLPNLDALGIILLIRKHDKMTKIWTQFQMLRGMYEHA